MNNQLMNNQINKMDLFFYLFKRHFAHSRALRQLNAEQQNEIWQSYIMNTNDERHETRHETRQFETRQLLDESNCNTWLHGTNKYDVLGSRVENGDTEFIDLFTQFQKMYFGFSRLATLYRSRRSTIANAFDLGLNPIAHTNPRKTFVIIQDKSAYIMTLPELINIINASLSYANTFFILQLYPAKNPYTNVPFNKSTLYNIYFAVKCSDYVMPPLLHAFFIHHFDLNAFENANKSCILEYAINRYVDYSHHDMLCADVMDMLSRNDSTRKWFISPDFPKNTLVDIMRPYLHMDLRIQYADVCDQIWTYLRGDLRVMLDAFYLFNPKFGRKYLHRRLPCTFDITHPRIVRNYKWHPNLIVNFF